MSQQQFKSRIIGSGYESPENLLANPENWRIHPKYQQDVLKGVLDEVGWVQNVIVNRITGHIVDGHLRVQLALRENQTEIPVVYVELNPDEERKILALIDPIGGLATTDQEMLNDLIAQIETDNEAIQELLDDLADLTDEDPPVEGEDEVPDMEGGTDTVCQPGDVWVLGEHKLICGDSTKRETYSKLLGDEQIDMVWTDPPYNVNYEGQGGMKIQNDNMGDAQFRAFLRDVFTCACAVTKEGCPIYIAHADFEGYNFRGAMVEGGYLLKQNLIWVKNSMVLGRQDYQWQHEPILYGWKPGKAHKWYGKFDKKTVIDFEVDPENMTHDELVAVLKGLRKQAETTIIRHDKPKSNGEHPTMKPVGLIRGMIKNSSKAGDLVMDMFGGSGSTLIACETTGRRGRLIELDPIYCDVILERFFKHTNHSPFRLSDNALWQDLRPIPIEEMA